MQENVETIADHLRALLDRPYELDVGIPMVQREIWDSAAIVGSDPRWEILYDLAYDLDYYEPDEKARDQNNSFFGAERALSEIREALLKLEGKK
jgi:hypothetical protein